VVSCIGFFPCGGSWDSQSGNHERLPGCAHADKPIRLFSDFVTIVTMSWSLTQIFMLRLIAQAAQQGFELRAEYLLTNGLCAKVQRPKWLEQALWLNSYGVLIKLAFAFDAHVLLESMLIWAVSEVKLSPLLAQWQRKKVRLIRILLGFARSAVTGKVVRHKARGIVNAGKSF